VDNSFLNSCDDLFTSTESVSIKRFLLEPIKISPIHFKKQSHYAILEDKKNFFILETSRTSQKYSIYDLQNAKIIKNDSLDYPPISIGQATFKSFDSIFFQLPEKSVIMQFDTSNQIVANVKLNDLNLDWQVQEGRPGLFNDINQAKLHFIDDSNFIFNVNPYDYWFYPKKQDIKLLSQFDITEKKLISNFSNINDRLKQAKISLPPKYTFPYLSLLDKDHIVVSYPYDHRLYKYNLKSKEPIETVCNSSMYIEALHDPLEKEYMVQESINFQISAPYYGQINFHSRLGIITRVVFHEKELYTKENELNFSSCASEYSLQVFDQDLKMLDEIHLGSRDLWEFALPTSQGYLLMGKCSNYSGEDYFKYNVRYELVKK